MEWMFCDWIGFFSCAFRFSIVDCEECGEGDWLWRESCAASLQWGSDTRGDTILWGAWGYENRNAWTIEWVDYCFDSVFWILRDWFCAWILFVFFFSHLLVLTRNYSEKVDSYSFGKMLFEMVTKSINPSALAARQFYEPKGPGQSDDYSVILDCDDEILINLVKLCCQQAPNQRPDFEVIVKLLNETQQRHAVSVKNIWENRFEDSKWFRTNRFQRLAKWYLCEDNWDLVKLQIEEQNSILCT